MRWDITLHTPIGILDKLQMSLLLKSRDVLTCYDIICPLIIVKYQRQLIKVKCSFLSSNMRDFSMRSSGPASFLVWQGSQIRADCLSHDQEAKREESGVQKSPSRAVVQWPMGFPPGSTSQRVYYLPPVSSWWQASNTRISEAITDVTTASVVMSKCQEQLGASLSSMTEAFLITSIAGKRAYGVGSPSVHVLLLLVNE